MSLNGSSSWPVGIAVVVVALLALGVTSQSDVYSGSSVRGVLDNPVIGHIDIEIKDTEAAGRVHVECDLTGRDYYKAWSYLYATPDEALAVGKALGIQGYHQHGEKFMPGNSHDSFVGDGEVAIHIPPDIEPARYSFREGDSEFITCFYTRVLGNQEMEQQGLVEFTYDGIVIDAYDSVCVHKSSQIRSNELHCAVLEISTVGEHTLLIVDRDEFP